jgi:spermidine synthase
VSDEIGIERARVPGGGELVLYKISEHFEIRVDGRELMATRSSVSEEQLAQVGCDGLAARPSVRVLIGGLGMGFTVRAALDLLADDAAVTVVEVVQAVVDWNRGTLADVAKRPLADPRVTVTVADIGTVLRQTKVRYDAILLDVDNSPEGLTRKANHALYTAPGIATAKMALRPNGRYAVWSACRNRGFEQRVRSAGLELQTHGTGHIVYCAVAPFMRTQSPDHRR